MTFPSRSPVRPGLAHVLALASISLPIALLGVVFAFLLAREMPGSVDLGTHRLRALARGAGSLTVVLESFGAAPLEIWTRIHHDVARFSSVFVYDHAGYWGSEPGPKPRDARRIATELHAALLAAGQPPPYLLVGYSFGGPYIRVFADLYPGEVAGMILVDPSQESFAAWLRRNFPRINVVTGVDRTRQEEWGCQEDSFAQASAARVPDVPITLISATATPDIIHRNLVPRIQQAHEDWLRPHPAARHVLASHADHGIVLTHPSTVVDEIRSMVDRIRATRPGTAEGPRPSSANHLRR